MSEIKSNILWGHEAGFKGIFRLYNGWNGVLKSVYLYVSFVLGLIVFGLLIIKEPKNKELLEIIEKLSQLSISIIASIVGLSLAGLTLVVAMSGGKFISSIISLYHTEVKNGEMKPKSVYQTTIAKFSFAILIQLLCLFYLIVLQFALFLKIEVGLGFAICINKLLISLAAWLLSYALLLVLQTVINVFTIGQMNHMSQFNSYLSEINKKAKS